MIINQVVSGGGTTPEPYPLLSRVIDDSNTDVGLVVGYHLDANNQRYAVIALNAVYRAASGQYYSSNTEMTNFPRYGDASSYGAKETATYNCDKILEWISDHGGSSSAVSHCRSQSFIIGGVTYYGQLPTITELIKVYEFRTEIENGDPTVAANPTLVLPVQASVWASTQDFSTGAWGFNQYGLIYNNVKNQTKFVPTILEIPIQ